MSIYRFRFLLFIVSCLEKASTSFHPKCDTFCPRKHVETGSGEDERGPRGGDEKNVARHNTLSVENDAALSVAASLPIVIFSVV